MLLIPEYTEEVRWPWRTQRTTTTVTVVDIIDRTASVLFVAFRHAIYFYPFSLTKSVLV